VIAPEDDQGVAGIGAGVEGVEHPPNLFVHEAHARQVGPHGLGPLAGLADRLELALAALGYSASRAKVKTEAGGDGTA